ncbi:MAPEG family protein [Nioella aestuarii]|uniref:MAPEG family protein n=1 Tax=Nioella aestuarii TaxID=1662864 RepID=UPI003D7F61EB
MDMIAPLYAGLLGLLFLYLSFRVIALRRHHRVSVGDGGQKALTKAMRTQANCVEYSSIGLILLVAAELQGTPTWAVHVLGVTLLLGRVLHAFGFGSTPQIVPARIWGMALTLGMILVASLSNIIRAII